MKQEPGQKRTGSPAQDSRTQRQKAALKANIARRKAQAAQRRDAADPHSAMDTGPGTGDNKGPVTGADATNTDRNAAE